MDNMSEGVVTHENIIGHSNSFSLPFIEKIDRIYNFIDELNLEEINEIIKYCEEQKAVIHLIDKRRKKLAEILRIERIKFRKEMNSMDKKLNERREKEESFESEEESIEIKVKPMKKKELLERMKNKK